jgi:hypothetical protein
MRDNADLDENFISIQRSKASIREVITQVHHEETEKEPKGDTAVSAKVVADTAEERLPALEEVTLLPRAGDPYKAYARPANQMLPMLYLLLANEMIDGFSLANLDRVTLLPSSDAGQGPVLVIKFGDTEVRLGGRHLNDLVSYVGFHRVAWIRERSPSRDFIPETETVVTCIKISKVEG